MGRGFLPQAKEVPARLAHKAGKEALTQDYGKKTAAAGLFSGAAINVNRLRIYDMPYGRQPANVIKLRH